ncbi:MAG: group II intron reverse transcriptase/maturase [Acidobacteriota bacterium]
MPQKPETGRRPGGRGESPTAGRRVEAPAATPGNGRLGASDLMERMVDPANLRVALQRVKGNKGSPGLDGMTVGELSGWLRAHWQATRERLLAGRYEPQAVKRQAIAKRGGGVRELGIPTVVDRFIQQALLQVLQPDFDRTFSEHSHGFRPGRRAHDAIKEAQRYVQEGRRWVVDVDLEKFFDRVNHDVLMGRLAKRIADRRVLRLIRRYLEAGVMLHGVVVERHEGTPQGGPLSPLLANVLLDEVDKELERRGHAFVRYADDCNIYVRSKKSGERVMSALAKLYDCLRLRINHAKSAVDLAQRRKFLGYSLWFGPGGTVKRRVASQALKEFKERVREITSRNGGRSLPSVGEELAVYLRGWKNYFQLAETPRIFSDLDEWIRHRLRALQLKQWRRGTTVYRELVRRGMSGRSAAGIASRTRRWWSTSGKLLNTALPNRWITDLGVPRLGA